MNEDEKVKELGGSVFFWKRAWELEVAHSQQAEKRIEELEKGIRKHRDENEWSSVYGNRDEELYKLLK